MEMVINDNLMKDYFWVVVLAIVCLTVFIAYVLNTNIDPEEDEHDWGNNDDEFKNNNEHED